MLLCLLERPGKLVTREALQRRLWGDETIVDFDHGLGTALNKLRELLLRLWSARMCPPSRSNSSLVQQVSPASPRI